MERKKDYSSVIENGFTDRRSNVFFEPFIKIFFNRIDFDTESIANLKDYSGKGRIAFLSFQSTNTSLLILINVLKKHGMKIPKLAIDYNPYFIQRVSIVVKKVIRRINVFAGKEFYERIPDNDYIKGLVRDGDSVILSLLSGKAFLKRYMEIKIDALQNIIEVQKEIEEPIFLFPQIQFWNRNPERTKALMTSMATGDRGLFSALFIMFKSATPAFIRVPPPLNLKEEIAAAESDDSRQIARAVRNKMLEIYNYEKRAILGPVIKSQQEMMEKVLYHKNVLDTINELVLQENRSQSKQRKKAYKYFKEIAADFSIIYIKFFEKSLDYIFSKIFDGIYYSIDDFKKIREASQKGPLILMPSHKSHMDYLILSSIFYRNKLIPPHIVAGSNLTFFPMGKIFRRSGAFFMRRSFKGLKLYTVVFKQYIKSLINEGYSIEFFIEGGRTRTGKLAFPKMGIMKYLMEAIEEGYNKDMVFVPTSINYDRILEESSYQKELKGREKKTESTSNFVKSRKLLKRKYGRVYLSFNEPVSYQELKEKFNQESDELTNSIGDFVVRRINEIIMVTPFSITSAAILLSALKGFSREIIRTRIEFLLDYLESTEITVSDTLTDRENIDEIIDYVLQSFKEDKIVREVKMEGVKGEVPTEADELYVINEEDRARINFYKNSSIHYLIAAGYFAAILNRFQETGIRRSEINDHFLFLKDIFSEEFIYMDKMENTDGVITDIITFLEKRGSIRQQDDTIFIADDRKNDIVFLSKLLHDITESYIVVFSEMLEHKNAASSKEINMSIRKRGIKMYHLGEITLTEALSMPNYTNAVNMLVNKGIVEQRATDKKNPDLKLHDPEKLQHLISELKAFQKGMLYYM